ncbi:MAG: PH domain-containing protein [Candidatus Micrarchaeia archaeon]
MPYDVKENPTSKTIRLSRKKIIKKTLKGTIVLAIAFILAILTFLFYPSLIRETISSVFILEETVILALLIMICVAVIIINFLYHYVYYKTYYYDIKNDMLVIRKGVFTPREISIPFSRIQDVYVDRDLLDLILGLYDVHVSSATLQSGVDAHIDGVSAENATLLKEIILEKVKKESKKESGLGER